MSRSDFQAAKDAMLKVVDQMIEEQQAFHGLFCPGDRVLRSLKKRLNAIKAPKR